MSYSKKENGFENFSENKSVGESFNYTKEGSNSVWNENFVYKHEENKITATNDVGFSGFEENKNASKKLREQKKIADENNDFNNNSSTSESASSSSASSSASSSSTSASATSTAASSTTAVSSGVATAASVATTAVVIVAGGGMVVYAQDLDKIQVAQFEYVEASMDTIYFAVAIGNDYEKITSGEENDECSLVVELTCQSYSDFKSREVEIDHFGVHENKFENLLPGADYTLNIVQLSLLDLQRTYLGEPYYIRTESDLIVPTAIHLNVDEVTINVNETYAAYVESTEPEGANNEVDWFSSDDSIATVDETGLITGMGAGVAEIKASSKHDGFVDDTITVTVNAVAPTAIVLSDSELTLEPDEEYRVFVEAVTPSYADTTVEWTSSDESVATVSEDGTITGIDGGTATITAAAALDKSVTATVEVTVNDRIIKPTSLTLNYNADQRLYVEDTLTLSISGSEPEDADRTVTWSSSDTEVATVTDGLVTALMEGEVTITATSIYNDVSASVHIVVEERPPEEVLPTSITLVDIPSDGLILDQDDTYTLSVVVEPEDATDKSVRFSSDNTDAVTVSDEGEITAVDIGKATITVSCVADSSVTAEVNITVVAKAPNAIIVSAASETVKAGDGVELTVFADPEGSDPSVTWSSSNESVATVDSSGVVTGVQEGTATITAASTKDTSIYGTIDITVEPSYGLHITGERSHLGYVTYYGGYTAVGEVTHYSDYRLTLYDTEDYEDNPQSAEELGGTSLELYVQGEIKEIGMDGQFDESGSYTAVLSVLKDSDQSREYVPVYEEILDFSTIIYDAENLNSFSLESVAYVNSGYDTLFTSYYGYVDIQDDSMLTNKFMLEFIHPSEGTIYSLDDITPRQRFLLTDFELNEEYYYDEITYKVYYQVNNMTSVSYEELYNFTFRFSDAPSNSVRLVDDVSYEFLGTQYSTKQMVMTVNLGTTDTNILGDLHYYLSAEQTGGDELFTQVPLTMKGISGSTVTLVLDEDPQYGVDLSHIYQRNGIELSLFACRGEDQPGNPAYMETADFTSYYRTIPSDMTYEIFDYMNNIEDSGNSYLKVKLVVSESDLATYHHFKVSLVLNLGGSYDTVDIDETMVGEWISLCEGYAPSDTTEATAYIYGYVDANDSDGVVLLSEPIHFNEL